MHATVTITLDSVTDSLYINVFCAYNEFPLVFSPVDYTFHCHFSGV